MSHIDLEKDPYGRRLLASMRAVAKQDEIMDGLEEQVRRLTERRDEAAMTLAVMRQTFRHRYKEFRQAHDWHTENTGPEADV